MVWRQALWRKDVLFPRHLVKIWYLSVKYKGKACNILYILHPTRLSCRQEITVPGPIKYPAVRDKLVCFVYFLQVLMCQSGDIIFSTPPMENMKIFFTPLWRIWKYSSPLHSSWMLYRKRQVSLKKKLLLRTMFKYLNLHTLNTNKIDNKIILNICLYKERQN